MLIEFTMRVLPLMYLPNTYSNTLVHHMKRAVEPSTHSYGRHMNTYSVAAFTSVYPAIVVHNVLGDCLT
jgi:hypothetical protein